LAMRHCYSRLTILITFVWSGTPANAQVVLVTPPAFATTSANNGNFGYFDTVARTAQIILKNSQLPGLQGGQAITGMAFRLDEVFGTPVSTPMTWSNYQITLGTAIRSPGSLSFVYAENMTDTTLVFSGPLTIAANSF